MSAFSIPRVCVLIFQTTHFAPPPRLLINIKNSKWFKYFCILLSIIMHLTLTSLICLAYFLSHDIFSHINSLGFLFIFCFSDEGSIHSKRLSLPSYPYRQYTNLFIFRFVSEPCLRSTTFTSRSN